jgi:hypothetical protein
MKSSSLSAGHWRDAGDDSVVQFHDAIGMLHDSTVVGGQDKGCTDFLATAVE